VEQQLQRGRLNSGKDLDYASGLALGKYRGLPIVDHGGIDAGYRADLLRFPDQHFSVACLCNKGDIFPVELTRRVADIYLAAQFKESAPIRPESLANSVAVSLQHLTQYMGLYWNNDDKVARRAVLRDGKLFVAGNELMPLSENHFQLAVDPDETYTFDKVTAVAPLQMTIQEPGEAPDVFDRITEFHATPSQLVAYAGFYASDEIDPVYRIIVEDGGLVLKRPKSKPQKLRPVLEDYFQGLGGVIHFTRDSAGKITGFVLNSDRIRNFHFRLPATFTLWV
jgi:hypothetical protein